MSLISSLPRMHFGRGSQLCCPIAMSSYSFSLASWDSRGAGSFFTVLQAVPWTVCSKSSTPAAGVVAEIHLLMKSMRSKVIR